MQTIEFEAQLNEGVIYLPDAFKHWHEGQKVKIIISSDDENQKDIAYKKSSLSCLDMVQADVGVINAPDDLSTNPNYLKGYGE